MDNPQPNTPEHSLEANVFALQQSLSDQNKDSFLAGLRSDELLSYGNNNILFIQPPDSDDQKELIEYNMLLHEAQTSNEPTAHVKMTSPDGSSTVEMEVTVYMNGSKSETTKITDFRALRRFLREQAGHCHLFIDNIGMISDSNSQAALRSIIDGDIPIRTYAISEKPIVNQRMPTSPLDNVFMRYEDKMVAEFDHGKAETVFSSFQQAMNTISHNPSAEITLGSRMGKTTFCKYLEKRYPGTLKYLTAQDPEFGGEDGLTNLLGEISTVSSNNMIVFIDEAQVFTPEQRKALESTGTKIVYINVSDFMQAETTDS